MFKTISNPYKLLSVFVIILILALSACTASTDPVAEYDKPQNEMLHQDNPSMLVGSAGASNTDNSARVDPLSPDALNEDKQTFSPNLFIGLTVVAVALIGLLIWQLRKRREASAE